MSILAALHVWDAAVLTRTRISTTHPTAAFSCSPPPVRGVYIFCFPFYFLIISDENIKQRPEHRYGNGKEPNEFIDISFKFAPE
jgi:hypothetical protein